MNDKTRLIELNITTPQHNCWPELVSYAYLRTELVECNQICSFGPTCPITTIILNPCKLTESTREWSSPLSLNNHFCILKMQLFSICRDQYFLIFQLKLFKFDKLCNVVICFTPQSFNHFFSLQINVKLASDWRYTFPMAVASDIYGVSLHI